MYMTLLVETAVSCDGSSSTEGNDSITSELIAIR